jgi:membrane protease subunit HflK
MKDRKTNRPHKMAWNEPGGSGGNKDPWGNNKPGGGQQMPPGFEEFANKIKEKFGGMFGGGSGKKDGKPGSSGGIFSGIGLILILLIVWILSGIYIVEPSERGVVLRFGKYVDTTAPGPHWHIPYPIESAEVLNVDRIRTLEIGYRSGGRTRISGSVFNEALMLTEDENIVNAKFAVQYKIKDARDFLFNVNNPTNSLYEVTQSAVRNVIGRNKMDFVLTEGRAEIAYQIESIIQSVIDKYQTGLEITSVNIQSAQPPDQVQAAFADANKAKEDKQRFINQAEAYRNKILPNARGQAARIIAEANAYKEQIEAKATGEASRFSQILSEYQKAPEVTSSRLYIETMEDVLSKNSKVVMDAEGQNSLMVLPLDKMFGSKIKIETGQVEPEELKSDNSEELKPDRFGRTSRTTRTNR